MKLKQRASLLALFALIPFLSSASIWDELKNTPANQYDVGRIFIEIAAIELDKRLENERIDGTKYKVSEISSISQNELGLKFSLKARGKHINPQDCSRFAYSLQQNFVTEGLIDETWTTLSTNLKNKLKQNFVVEVELINKDNDAVITTCRPE